LSGHDHEEDHAHGEDSSHRVVEVHQAILAQNDRQAERNRGYFRALGILTVNMVSAPGSGKTELIRQTITALGARLRVGVIVGDVATDQDARRLRGAGVPVVQITTGTLCHLDAGMVARAVGRLDAGQLDLLFLENVGNLVCPAAFDLGEDLRVVLLSVTEGEDKPLKYPPLFHSAHAAVLTKLDLAEPAGFNRDAALANLRRVSHHAEVFELSARSGQGMEAWCAYLVRNRRDSARRPAVSAG
jgi:hydrogenase nickel incorporation protein HypB